MKNGNRHPADEYADVVAQIAELEARDENWIDVEEKTRVQVDLKAVEAHFGVEIARFRKAQRVTYVIHGRGRSPKEPPPVPIHRHDTARTKRRYVVGYTSGNVGAQRHSSMALHVVPLEPLHPLHGRYTVRCTLGIRFIVLPQNPGAGGRV